MVDFQPPIRDVHLIPKCYRVSKNGSTPKWMVYFMENIIKMDDLGVKTTISG